ncbi:hypothetical protein J3T78_03585 [Staphylococcus nepalensis]|uniref:Uncharacterized protein n=2 Tax=Staphylococcus nepalensis TaxID=214473 RepID=A0ABS3KXG5_9STAP|nr:hypothetical protein [Staphylococcus nepalensis]MBO1215339.1 hypothetical protein [Staphylococcus nepalensis]MBO1225981.1 hypothetical protein [Staphylococcus nepalensis]MBO1234409.1 hypothetical protein [Staphylococcus nepalensis]MBO1236791.1 hypothetical protein [Staphylococcus nepalensis]
MIMMTSESLTNYFIQQNHTRLLFLAEKDKYQVVKDIICGLQNIFQFNEVTAILN